MDAAGIATHDLGQLAEAGVRDVECEVDALRLHVPAAAASGNPLPLVLNLHGATQNAQLEEITSDMDPNADMNGYLVAYPDGTRIAKVLTPDPVIEDVEIRKLKKKSLELAGLI